MNLDLITKLAKLANNNPNDNEANLAARRACKLIEEGKFQFGVDSSKVNTKSQVNQQPQYSNPFDAFNNYYQQQKQRTATEYQQAKEQQERHQREQNQQQNTGQYRCKNCGAHLDYIAVALGNTYCNNCKQQKAKQEDDKQYKSYKYDFSNIKFDGPSWFEEATSPKPKSPPQENVTVKCLFCKQDFKRKEFRTDFICHQCYVKKNKSEKPPIKDDPTRTYYKSVFCFACGHGFTVTYTEFESEKNDQVIGNCEKCKAQYIRATK